jgi:uncharacterized protein (DUF3084 family)
MATTSIIFIVVTIAVSGFVAWAGDTLGRVLGKKRISLFGLRPKKASVLIAVITGMLITALTITAMAFMSDTVRKMLLQMDDILNNLTTLQSNLDDLQGNYDKLQGNYDGLMIEYGHLSETHSYQVSQYEVDIAGFENQITELNTGKTSLDAEIADLTRNISNLNAQYQSTKADLGSQIDSLNLEISDRESRVEDLNSQIESKNEQIASLNVRLTEIQQELSSHELGTIKVYEGQQLGVVLINTQLDQATIYDLLRGWVDSIPDTYMDPQTGDLVLMDSRLEVTADDYYTVLQEIRDVGSDRAVVIAYASENVVEQMAVPVRFEVSRNRLMYSAGTRIYSHTYDAPVGATDPYRAVSAQFFEDARDYLVNQAGLIPSSANQIMQFTIDDLLNLAQQMAATGFPVELKMMALTDIYSTDFLVYGQQFTVSIGNAVHSDLE